MPKYRPTLYFLTDVEKLHVEDERCIRRNCPPCSPRTVAQIRRDLQPTLAADLHAHNSLIPSLDHVPRAKLEGEWLVAIDRAIELFAIRQPARVVDADVHASDRRFAG